MADPIRTSSVSTEIKIEEAKAGLYGRLIFGGFCILSGAACFIWGVMIDLNHPACGTKEVFWTISHILMAGGFLWALLGAASIPSIFDTVLKPVVTLVFPNGIPLIGGRRTNDPPAGQ